MDSVGALFVPVHILFGWGFLFTMLVTQLVIRKVMFLFPDTKEKQSARSIIGSRIRRSMDIVIIVMTITGLFFLHSRWSQIVLNPVFIIKICLGATALLIANFLHFILPTIKARLIAKNDSKKIITLNKLSVSLETAVMVLVLITALLGLYINHY